MQVKLTPMKNVKTKRPEGSRDHFRHMNKAKTLRIKQSRKAKQFTGYSATKVAVWPLLS